MKIQSKTKLLILISTLILCGTGLILARTVYRADILSTNNINLYVATTGNDSTGNGTEAKPFATIQKSRDYIRTLKTSKQFTKPVIVNIKAGTYEQDKSIDFTTEDSGTAAQPITYQGYGGEVKISGAKKITNTWTKCTANTCPGLPNPTKVYVTDLKTDPYFKFLTKYCRNLHSHAYLEAYFVL